MNYLKVKNKVNAALDKLYSNDIFLFEEGLCEMCINHRFAMYLQELFGGYFVDCEYNKSHQGETTGIKRVSNPRGNYIDIVIGKRNGIPADDLVCFETKWGHNYNNRKKDRDNLKILTGKDGRFDYDYGFYILFGKERKNIKIEAYENGELISSQD